MSDNLSVSEVNTASDFLALRAEWNDLVESDELATFFQTWEFQYHTWRISADRVTPCLLLVRDRTGTLIACAPLAETFWRMGPLAVRILEFSSGRYSDYSNFILRGNCAEYALGALAGWFQDNLRRWDVVRFQPVREDSLLMCEHLFLSKIGCLFRIKQRSAAPFLRFQPGWTNYEDALSRKRAKSMRYEIRNLFRKFQGRFEEAAKGNSIDSAINQLIDLHQKRMREKHQVGAFDMPRAQEEFQALVKALSDRGVCKVHSIRSDQRTIASVITFEFRGIVSYFQVGFDPDSRCLSPGKVLQALRINKAIQDGALEFDFLDGDEAYKRVWANGQRRLYSIEILTGSWRALAYYWWDRLRIRLAESDRLRSLNLWLRGR